MQRPSYSFPERPNTPPGLGGQLNPRFVIETPHTPPADEAERVTRYFDQAQRLALDWLDTVPNLDFFDAVMLRLDEMERTQRTHARLFNSMNSLADTVTSLRADLAKAIAERDDARRELQHVTAYSLQLKQEAEKRKSGAEDSKQVNAEQAAGNPGSLRSSFGRR
ncbi:hypothetical protein AYO21_09153 [Fonsecaea monophora]|uniref:Uncharacterized protein n=1 Tax=Fonsecaea monophora TaxID=254056 RepID=A0A177EXJ9_9EURO|nr:hypothetical protein AYO21_09153 [Fonsecaea monophora]OAG36678.1 hypothetical protein AYO21_09153 [Fonsecaea monophora]